MRGRPDMVFSLCAGRSPAPYRRGEASKFWRTSPVGQLNDASLGFFLFFFLSHQIKIFKREAFRVSWHFGNLEYGKRKPIWVVRLVIIRN